MRFLDGLLAFLYPPACPACGEPEASDSLCRPCGAGVASPRGLVAPAPLRDVDVVAACLYHGVVRDLVLRLKYGRDPHAARALGALLREAIGAFPAAAACDAVVPVPLSRRRLRARGFNQAALIAHVAAHGGAIPILPRLLVRARHAPPQEGLGPRERARNVAAAFRAGDGNFGRAVLLVDDVITTGHTMAQAAAALLAGGARRVVCAAVAASGWERAGPLRSDPRARETP